MCYCPYLYSLQWIIVSVWLHCPLHYTYHSFLYTFFSILFLSCFSITRTCEFNECTNPPLSSFITYVHMLFVLVISCSPFHPLLEDHSASFISFFFLSFVVRVSWPFITSVHCTREECVSQGCNCNNNFSPARYSLTISVITYHFCHSSCDELLPIPLFSAINHS